MADVITTLNELRARELAVIMQYMRHHYLATGVDGLAVGGEFRSVAIAEMKHAEMLAERINFLGGDPTTKPWEIRLGQTTVEEMAAADAGSETEAVDMYKAAIESVGATSDVTTRRMLEDILADEEDHLDTFNKMLGK